jgi:cytochrome c oxidase subunit 1
MSSIFGIFGAIYFWFPKMFGRMLNEPLGKIHFFLTFVASNCLFFPMHIIGIGGHPRRYADPTMYKWLEPLQPLNIFMTVSAIVLGLSQIVFLFNFFWSLFRGPKAERNPWKSNTLEWTAPSPPPHGNFATEPVVYHGPYEYNVPEMAEDFLPQTDKTEVKVGEPAHAH